MGTARAKKNREFQKLLDEVEGVPAKPAKGGTRGPEGPEVGESHVPYALREKPLRVTAQQRQAFHELCAKRQKIDHKIELLESDRMTLEARIQKVVELRGAKIREKDLVFFAAPFKAQLNWRSSVGDLDQEPVLEWAHKHAPALVLRDVHATLDVALLQERGALPKVVKQALEVVLDHARKAAPETLQEGVTELLDLGRYQEMLEAAEIPEFVQKAAKVEGKGHYALRIDTLDDDVERCTSCGERKPKRKSRHAAEVCKRCGAKN
jgi:uncharacterized protein YdcH (DUF465 family)